MKLTADSFYDVGMAISLHHKLYALCTVRAGTLGLDIILRKLLKQNKSGTANSIQSTLQDNSRHEAQVS